MYATPTNHTPKPQRHKPKPPDPNPKIMCEKMIEILSNNISTSKIYDSYLLVKSGMAYSYLSLILFIFDYDD